MASTITSTDLRAVRQASWAAPVAIAGAAYFALAVAALHFLRPDLDPVSRMTSEYANGPYGFVMTSAFFSMVLASAALIVALYRGAPRHALSLTGLVFLGMWAAGVLVAMIFPIDPGGVPVTPAGTIHQTMGPPTFLAVTTGVALVTWRLGRDERWRGLQRTLFVLVAVIALGFVATAYTFFTGVEIAGLMQRIVLAAVVTWIVLVATRLRPTGAKFEV
ncbi:MAG TPA: DUF998 domain-containing protein [Chloroflexia bacterium]|nr:DUF998 domain-containing protein [Chloroflexia bacterium]